MTKGLTSTLAAVATAWLGVQAFAITPVIESIPSPIISDGTAQTEANVFVYPDALDLDAYVSDQDGDDASIQWTHWSATGRYIFNGAQPLDLGTDSAITPPLAKVINRAETITASGEINPDGDATTATARDQKLSPLTGQPTDTAPASAGIIREELVTFFASDGNAVTSDTVWVYTENDGTDRLSSPGGPGPVPQYTETFNSGQGGWAQVDGLLGNATTQYANQKLCITVGTTGENMAQWASPYGLVDLAKNSVYRVRIDMTTNQTVARSVPLWDFVFQNIEGSGNPPRGDFAYGADYWFLDNVESNNAVKGPANGRNVFYCWFTPGAVLTPQWNSDTTGAFTTANAPQNDFRMMFRIIDSDGAGIVANEDSGQICLDTVAVDKFDLANLQTISTMVNLQTFQGGNDAGSNAANGVRKRDVLGSGTDGAGSVVSFPNGGDTMRVVPARSEGWKQELTFFTPGDSTNPNLASGEYGNGAATLDNYPIPWNSDQLYMMRVVTKAPDQLAVDNGPDCVRLGYEAKTLELLGDQYILTGLGRAGAPKLQAAPYVFFYWTHTKTTLTNPPQAAFLAWKLDVFNSQDYNRPTFNVLYNKGGVDFESLEVLRVAFPGMEQ